MNKTKVFELKIEDDDELSGIDSISLVDEPAIEVNWIAFKKEKEHEFHIPDNEDQKYIDMLTKTAQDEQELFDEGWVVSSVKIMGEEDFFSTNPNGPSVEDEKEYNVRYKYILNPRISQSAIIPTTRDFCKTLINKNYVWRVEDMDATRNDFGDSALVWRGGYNCRHVWSRIEYKKDATIINKASVNKGKVTVAGFPTDMIPDVRVLGYDEPSTVTKATAANPKPSTVKNLGLSKENFESYSDYPDSVKNNAKAVLKYVDENGWGSCGTEIGKIRANQLAKGEPISKDTIQRMYSYLSRHAGDLDSSKGYGDGCGKLMYDSWGGKSALSWAEAKVKQFNIEEFAGEKVSMDYDDTLSTDKGKELAKRLLSEGKDLHIVTRRQETDLGPVYKVAEGLGVSRDKVHATNGKLKWETIKRLGIQTHYDNNPDEIKAIQDNLQGVRGIKFDYDVSGLPPYVDELPKKKPIPKSIMASSNYLDQFEYLHKTEMKKQHFQTDEEKHIVLGPAMIPDQRIFRKDDKGEPYYVFFSPETIKMIAEKYMRNKYTDNNDLMHDGQAIKDIHVLESWIVEDPENDKSKKYGFDVPSGTWMISMKVNNQNVWEQIKDKKLNGFSVSGFFEEVAAFCREEMFLKQVVEILKNIKD